jgi:hypothetical protein
MDYLTMKEKIAKLNSQLDNNFNMNVNQSRKRTLFNIPNSFNISNFENILFQNKNNSYRATSTNSKIKSIKKDLLKSNNLYDFENDESLNYNRKNHINKYFQKKYNELKSFTNEFNPNSFDEDNNYKRNKSSYFNVFGSIHNKNDKKISKKDQLTKEIISELGKGNKDKSLRTNQLIGRSVLNYFTPRETKDQFIGIQGVNII